MSLVIDMMNHTKKYILIITLCFIPALLAQDIQISASIDRIKVGLNQSFTYSVEISGEKANSVGEPRLPDFNEFAVYLGSSGTSQNIQIINGKMSVSRSMSFSYMANKIGKFRIAPSAVEYNGKEYASAALEIEVVAQASKTPQANPQPGRSRTTDQDDQSAVIENNLFLRPFVDKKTAYINEPIILSYKIYTAVTVTSYGISKTPNTTGFWAEEFPMENQPRTYKDTYKGREFIAADIRKIALFPTDPGIKTITPMEIECDVRIQNKRRSIFDSFFDDPFFGRSVRYTVASPTTTIEVLPLPEEGRPADFSGVVGDYSVSVNVDKNQVKTNEALALKVKISGAGNIKVLPPPKIDIPADFEKYDPKISENINRANNTISGSKTFEYVLIPRFPGIQKIKPHDFTYFDLKSRSYKRIRIPEIIIDVEKGNDEFMLSGAGFSKEEVRLLGKDIRFIQKDRPEFKRINASFYKSPWYLALLIAPLFVLGYAIGYRRHLDKLSDNVAYARSRRANQMAMNRLKRAHRLLSEKTQKEFYAETANALLGFLGDKLNIPAAGIITDEVEGMMRNRHIADEVVDSYLKCLQLCDFQRFAPANSTLSQMKNFYEHAKQAIIALEKEI